MHRAGRNYRLSARPARALHRTLCRTVSRALALHANFRYDAFSSDAIPVHLLTVEALRIYLKKTADHGLVVFHISDSHFQLWPVVASLVKEVGASARRENYIPSAEERATGAADSEWVIVAKQDQDLAALDADRRWLRFVESEGTWTWTDDFSNVLSLIHFR